jgi:ABC-2 type transport system permease protein
MRRVIRAIKVYLIALKNAFACRMAYRADFFFCSFMIFVTDMGIPFITMLIYGNGSSFPGWTLHETLLLQGIFMLSKGIANLLFFGMVWDTLSRVREGSYDLLLLKPGPVLFQSVINGFEPDSLGTVFCGVLIVRISLKKLDQPDWLGWAWFSLLMFFSLLVLFSFALLMAGSMFKWVGNSRIYEIFDSITAFGNYPRSIFSKAFQNLISYIIPIAIIGFFPASALLGKSIDGALAAMGICLVFFIFSMLFWRKMLSLYTSAGG